MTVLIASSFTKSLDRLTGQEQSQAKITAFDIQQNPDSPGLSLHRLHRCKDPDFWSARVSSDLRIILHKRGEDTLLAYVGHHDDAYDWAQRRRLDRHPRTGAAQIVEIRETVEEIVTQRFVEEEIHRPPLFASESDESLLSWGVPEDWLETVRQANEDTVLEIASHLPDEAQEALLAAAVGEAPTVRILNAEGSGFSHPDALRRFRVVGNDADLAAALDAPWDEWAIFLHPAQQEFVDRNFSGPARVIGSAGTGKTVVALHRAVRLAHEDQDSHVLLTTFSDRLAQALAEKLDRLTHIQPDLRDRIDVRTLSSVARELSKKLLGKVNVLTDAKVDQLLSDVVLSSGSSVDPTFLKDEWHLIVDAWDIRDSDTYRDLPRLGRKIRMASSRRDELWDLFAEVRKRLEQMSCETEAGLMHRLSQELENSPYTHVVVDESQDISVPELHLLNAFAGNRPNGLFFAGDIGQRIFRSAFPWKSAGVEIQGRSRSLKVNYRTSHQIRAKSDLLLPSRIVEADGGEENRLGVTSVFHGPLPQIELFDTAEDESNAVGEWIKNCIKAGLPPTNIVILVRSDQELSRGQQAIEISGQRDVHISLMHDAKGSEYRAVAVMACDADVIPSEQRLLSVSDEREMREVFDTERHLLYVAATRAREKLWISSCRPQSEFIDDLVASEFR